MGRAGESEFLIPDCIPRISSVLDKPGRTINQRFFSTSLHVVEGLGLGSSRTFKIFNVNGKGRQVSGRIGIVMLDAFRGC